MQKPEKQETRKKNRGQCSCNLFHAIVHLKYIKGKKINTLELTNVVWQENNKMGITQKVQQKIATQEISKPMKCQLLETQNN